MKFKEVKDALTAIEYMSQLIEDGNYVFDGYERVSINETLSDPLKRVYRQPRYNPQTVKFVCSLGSTIDAELLLYQSLKNVEAFKLHEDDRNFVLETRFREEKLYIKVYDEDNDLPIIIFHGYSKI